MAFIIDFTDDPDEYPGEDQSVPAAVGLLVLGNWHESFLSTLGEWNRQTYRSQWMQSLERFIKGASKEVLITEYLSPGVASHLVWWALFRGEGDRVYVQNHIVFYDRLDRGFVVEEASSFLADRKTVDEEGNTLSEWQVSLREVEFFFHRVQPSTGLLLPN